MKAGTQERAIFLEAVSAALRERYAVRVPVLRIRPGAVWKTQLRADRMAIAGSALLQIPAQDPGTYHSYRVFAVLEEEQGQYQPVLTSLRKSIINLGEGMQTTKLGEELDEGEQTDKEEFFDNFPVFAGEPDAVITRHYFYEAWSFSIYRWRNGLYHRVYTGCGGGV